MISWWKQFRHRDGSSADSTIAICLVVHVRWTIDVLLPHERQVSKWISDLSVWSEEASRDQMWMLIP
jgi:hypothetical protein